MLNLRSGSSKKASVATAEQDGRPENYRAENNFLCNQNSKRERTWSLSYVDLALNPSSAPVSSILSFTSPHL